MYIYIYIFISIIWKYRLIWLFWVNAFYCVMINDRISRKIVHKRHIWTVWRPYVSCNGVSVRRIWRISIHIPAIGRSTAFPLELKMKFKKFLVICNSEISVRDLQCFLSRVRKIICMLIFKTNLFKAYTTKWLKSCQIRSEWRVI